MSTSCLFLFPQDYFSTASPSPPVPWAVSASPSPVPPSSCRGPLCTVAVAHAPMEDWDQVKCPKATWGRAWLLRSLPWDQCQSSQSRTHRGRSNSLTFTIKAKTIPVGRGRNTLGRPTSAVGGAAGL